jgi:hypothetical protein
LRGGETPRRGETAECGDSREHRARKEGEGQGRLVGVRQRQAMLLFASGNGGEPVDAGEPNRVFST